MLVALTVTVSLFVLSFLLALAATTLPHACLAVLACELMVLLLLLTTFPFELLMQPFNPLELLLGFLLGFQAHIDLTVDIDHREVLLAENLL